MKRRLRLLTLLALLTAPTLLTAQNPKTQPRKHVPRPTTAAITAADLETRLYVFAADSMEGRETGTRGHVKSTRYIAAQLQALGLKPLGDDGTYFQNVPVVRHALVASSTVTAGDVVLHAGTDFLAAPGRGRVGPNAGPTGQVIYGGIAGDSTLRPSGADVRGKIVLLRQPPQPPGAGRGGFGRGGRGGGALGRGGFGRGLEAAGAVAVISVVDEIPATQVQAALHPREGQVALKGEPTDSASPAITVVSRAAAERLLGGSLDGMARGTVGKAITATDIGFVDTDAPARNVVAAYEGHDPVLKNEWVAMGAHSDHIGVRVGGPLDHDSLHLYAQAAYPIRERINLYNLQHRVCGGRLQQNCHAATPEDQAHLDSLNGQIAAIRVDLDSVRRVNGGVRRDSINNGADDDGSGSVTLLEIAERFAKERPKTKRSILFVWHTGEEKGLWGSRYITDHPPVPRDSIVAQLNMDMVGRGDASDLMEGGRTYLQLVGSRRVSTELGDIVEALNKQEASPFRFDYQFDANGHPENIYCRSDHFNYARYGIPIVFFTTGLHGDYHQVTDEPEYIDYRHMAKIGNFVYTLAEFVANMDHRPRVDHPVGDPNARCQQ